MTDLTPLLTRAAREYETRRAAAEAEVVRWEYWSAPAYDPKPFYFERAARGRRRGPPPRRLQRPTAHCCAYGFDAAGRVVVDRQPRSSAPAYDEFFSHARTGIESAAYGRGPSHPLQYVTRQRRRNGRPLWTAVLDATPPGTAYVERYGYRGGRLTRIDVRTAAGPADAPDTATFDVVYESDGRPRTVRRQLPTLDQPFPVWWNPALRDTLDKLADDVRRRLLDAIPAAVRRARVREPAWCLALAYDEAEDELPPRLAVGLDAERRRRLAAGGNAARAALWDPTRFPRHRAGRIPLSAPGLAEACEKLHQLVLMKQAMWVPRRLLNAVAANLNRRRWAGILPTTDDFVVYATDLELDGLKANLKAAVPPAKLKVLKSRGML